MKSGDMWTIRFAERLRFPRVPCLGWFAAGQRGEMLAFAYIPTDPAADLIVSLPKSSEGGCADVKTRPSGGSLLDADPGSLLNAD